MQTNEQNVIDFLKFKIELAMQTGGAFEDCMTPAQAIELVQNDEDIEKLRRARNGHGALPRAA